MRVEKYDRVIFVGEKDSYYSLKATLCAGCTGTVMAYEDGILVVEFDEYINGHDCNGKCADGYGQYVRVEDVEKYHDAEITEESWLSILMK